MKIGNLLICALICSVLPAITPSVLTLVVVVSVFAVIAPDGLIEV
ncbi:hypothetical protein N9L59_00710 [Luminiphilus sp.]|nr:hypothetical protein [Luminiphilus sp.]